MTTATNPAEGDPLAYVLAQLEPMKTKEINRVAVAADLSPNTIYRIKGGHNVQYDTVIKLRDVLVKAEEEAAAALVAAKPKRVRK